MQTPKGSKNFFDISEKARKVLKFQDIKDKVICFVASWERSRASYMMPIEDDCKEYILDEVHLFSAAKSMWYRYGNHTFIAFREFEKDADEVIETEEWERKYIEELHNDDKYKDLKNIKPFLSASNFLKKNSAAYFDWSRRTDAMMGKRISILPKDAAYIEYLKHLRTEDRIQDSHEMKILAIDYRKFFGTILYHYLCFIEMVTYKKKIKVSDELRPLYDMFFTVSMDIRLGSFVQIKHIIERAYSKKLQVADWDVLENYSTNHLQHIDVPAFWQQVQKDGYLSNEFVKNVEFLETGLKEDFRVFHSFESLLFYELLHCIYKIKRCQNCQKPLPDMHPDGKIFSGKYCPSWSKDTLECFKERNKKRQKKHYNSQKT